MERDYGTCQDCREPIKLKRRRGRCDRCYQRLRRSGGIADLCTTGGRPNAPLIDKFTARVDVREDGCWPWTGRVAADTGYGYLPVNRGTSRIAHRVSYELFIGPIPTGMHLDHICHNADTSCPGGVCAHRRCVNPHHLVPKTCGENTLASPHTMASRWGRRTHCDQGHEFTDANTAWVLRGDNPDKRVRRCRACSRDRHRARRDATMSARIPASVTG